MSGTDVVRDIPQLQLPASRRKISIFKDKRSSRTKISLSALMVPTGNPIRRYVTSKSGGAHG